MKIYVAGPWVRKAEVIEAANLLRAEGHFITSRWFEHVGDPKDNTGSSLPADEIRFQAEQDILDVLAADVIVVLNLEKSEGKAVETGVALANGIPLISVGKRSNIFQILGTEVATIEEAVALLTPTFLTDSDPADEN